MHIADNAFKLKVHWYYFKLCMSSFFVSFILSNRFHARVSIDQVCIDWSFIKHMESARNEISG